MNTNTEVKLPATNGIAFSVTPEQAMELISYLASWAKDGKTFDVTVNTQSNGWDSPAPVAVGKIEVSTNWTKPDDKKLVMVSV
jgi:hypothetical protein